MKKSAKISPCGQYRYTLRRNWQGKDEATKSVAFVMLNPSVADGENDDPTLKRVIGFAKQNGFNDVLVVNLFALISSDPKRLQTHDDPIGEDNEIYLRHAVKNYGVVILAWGAEPIAESEALNFLSEFTDDLDRFKCLGRNKNGSPKHPLYLSKATKIIGFKQAPNENS